MKFITISIYISLCILFVGCKKTNSSTNEMCNCSVESIEDELELLCLKSKNDSMTLSMEITSDNMVNDYNYRPSHGDSLQDLSQFIYWIEQLLFRKDFL